jgi:hypothetical protein
MRNVVQPSLMKMLLHFKHTFFVSSSVFLLVFEKLYEENKASDMSCFQVQLPLPLEARNIMT